MHKILIVVVVWLGLTTVPGYKGGAPASACGSMQPSVDEHSAEGQTGNSLYTLSFGSNVMHYGSDDIKITISGDTLRGFMCQIRDSSDTQVGSFTPPDDTLSTLDCPGGTNSSITHTENSDKTNVIFMWTPPSSDMGELTLRCTLVKEKAMYWVGVEASQTLTQTVTRHADSDSASAIKQISTTQKTHVPRSTTTTTPVPHSTATTTPSYCSGLRPGNCYDMAVRGTCSSFCSMHYDSSRPDCPYGDHYTWCRSSHCSSSSLRSSCCATCVRQ